VVALSDPSILDQSPIPAARRAMYLACINSASLSQED
jgi:hypothetical protein